MAKSQTTNARLKKAIEKHFGNIATMCRVWPGCKGRASAISALIHLRASPIKPDPRSFEEAQEGGNYSNLCVTLSEAVGIFPEKLFPVELYAEICKEKMHPWAFSRLLEVTTVVRLSKKMERELDQLMRGAGEAETLAEQSLLRSRVLKVLKTLPYREREVLKLRFGLGDGYSFTLEEVGHVFKTTRDRIRQIENKAVSKLKLPSRSQELKGFLD